MLRVLRALTVFVGMIAFAPLTFSAGNLTKRATRLAPLELDGVKGFSQKNYDLETGKYYRWRITSDGREEYKILAPGLFRNSWINQVVIEDKEVKPNGLYAVEFDSAGTIDIWFIPIRPGNYPFYVENFETQGFHGVMRVR